MLVSFKCKSFFPNPLDSAVVFRIAKNFYKFIDAYKTLDLIFSSPVKHKLVKLGIKKLFRVLKKVMTIIGQNRIV